MNEDREDEKQHEPATERFPKVVEDEIRKAIRVGIDHADRGEVAPLDVQETLAKVRKRREKTAHRC